MKFDHRILLLPCCLILLLLSACSPTYTTALQEIRQSKVCCSTLEEVVYEPLMLETSVSFTLDNSSNAFQFREGKSFIKAFRLPQFTNPYYITINSYLISSNIDSAYLFFPQVITLDTAYSIIRRSDSEMFILHKAGFFETMRETGGVMKKLVGVLPFDEDTGEKYLIVHTTDELLGCSTSTTTMRITPIILPGISTAIPSGKKEVLIRHAPVGRIKITLKYSIPEKSNQPGDHP